MLVTSGFTAAMVEMYAGSVVVVVGGTVVVVLGAVVDAGRLIAARSLPPSPPQATRTAANTRRPSGARETWLRTRVKPSSVPSRGGSARAESGRAAGI